MKDRSKGVLDKHAQRTVEHAIHDRLFRRRVHILKAHGKFKGIVRVGTTTGVKA